MLVMKVQYLVEQSDQLLWLTDWVSAWVSLHWPEMNSEENQKVIHSLESENCLFTGTVQVLLSQTHLEEEQNWNLE